MPKALVFHVLAVQPAVGTKAAMFFFQKLMFPGLPWNVI
jgi:hypothetical protein